VKEAAILMTAVPSVNPLVIQNQEHQQIRQIHQQEVLTAAPVTGLIPYLPLHLIKPITT
jgi:hypothetical protein